MTLPRVYALLERWQQWPPAAEAIRLAWFKDTEGESVTGEDGAPSSPSNDSAVPAFIQAEGVSMWSGPPAFRPEDVIRLADRMRKHGG